MRKKRSSRQISRIISVLLGVSMMFSLSGCGKNFQKPDDELNVQTKQLSVKDTNEEAGEGMILRINGEEYPVEWENNESVEALKAMCPLTVELSMYGGFEQVGSLGKSLPKNDEQPVLTDIPAGITIHSI